MQRASGNSARTLARPARPIARPRSGSERTSSSAQASAPASPLGTSLPVRPPSTSASTDPTAVDPELAPHLESRRLGQLVLVRADSVRDRHDLGRVETPLRDDLLAHPLRERDDPVEEELVRQTVAQAAPRLDEPHEGDDGRRA